MILSPSSRLRWRQKETNPTEMKKKKTSSKIAKPNLTTDIRLRLTHNIYNVLPPMGIGPQESERSFLLRAVLFWNSPRESSWIVSYTSLQPRLIRFSPLWRQIRGKPASRRPCSLILICGIYYLDVITGYLVKKWCAGVTAWRLVLSGIVLFVYLGMLIAEDQFAHFQAISNWAFYI